MTHLGKALTLLVLHLCFGGNPSPPCFPLVETPTANHPRNQNDVIFKGNRCLLNMRTTHELPMSHTDACLSAQTRCLLIKSELGTCFHPPFALKLLPARLQEALIACTGATGGPPCGSTWCRRQRPRDRSSALLQRGPWDAGSLGCLPGPVITRDTVVHPLSARVSRKGPLAVSLAPANLCTPGS